jgi:alpha-tubulin suppressor-like RCC1 family protein
MGGNIIMRRLIGLILIMALILVVSVASLGAFSISLKPTVYKNVWTWGSGASSTPTKLDLNNIRDITDSMYVKSDGTVWTISGTQIAGLSNIISITEGRSCLALDSQGVVWAWGDNTFGQLGNGTFGGSSSTPTQVTGLNHVIAISTGIWQNLALKSDGTVWGWGHNAEGELGDGDQTDTCLPVQVLNLAHVIAIQCGYSCMALESNGTVWGWGWNRFGEAGNGTTGIKTSPVKASIAGVISISGFFNGDTSYAVKNDGTVWVWGCNALYDGNNQLSPVKKTGINQVKAIASAGSCEHVCVAVLKANRTVWAWGDNTMGELGDGTNISRSTPAQVSGITVSIDKLNAHAYGYYALKTK